MVFPGADASVVRRTQSVLTTGMEQQDDADAADNRRGKMARAALGGVRGGVQTAVYMLIAYGWVRWVLVFFGALFRLLVSFSFGRALLWRYPRLFSFGVFGRTVKDEDLVGAGFRTTFVARGVKGEADAKDDGGDSDDDTTNKKKKKVYEVVTRFAGPEPGYIATSSMLVESCLAVLEAVKQRRQQKGGGGGGGSGGDDAMCGVLTPGIALAGTRFEERIQRNGHGIELSLVSEGPLEAAGVF